jgi:hypothetical protein
MEIKMKLVIKFITFGERYLLAILFYLGFALIFTAITPDSPNLSAEPSVCGAEMVCESGMVCCGGVCCYQEDCESDNCGGCGYE